MSNHDEKHEGRQDHADGDNAHDQGGAAGDPDQLPDGSSSDGSDSSDGEDTASGGGADDA